MTRTTAEHLNALLPIIRRIPTSSYAQLKARRTYYLRNRPAVLLQMKMRRAGLTFTTAEARAMLAVAP